MLTYSSLQTYRHWHSHIPFINIYVYKQVYTVTKIISIDKHCQILSVKDTKGEGVKKNQNELKTTVNRESYICFLIHL